MMTNNHKTSTKMIIQTQRWEDGTVRSNYSLTATSHPWPPPSLYRLSRWAAGLAKCDSNHLLLSWTSSISNWSATAVNVLSSWAHPHSSKPHIAFHYNCRSNSDDLENDFNMFQLSQRNNLLLSSTPSISNWSATAVNALIFLNTFSFLRSIYSIALQLPIKYWILMVLTTFSQFPPVAQLLVRYWSHFLVFQLLQRLPLRLISLDNCIRCEEDSLHWNVAIFCENDLLTKMYIGSLSHVCPSRFLPWANCCDTKQTDNNALPMFEIPQRSHRFLRYVWTTFFDPIW